MMDEAAATKVESGIMQALAKFQESQRQAMLRDGLDEVEIIAVLHQQRAQFVEDSWQQARQAMLAATGADIGLEMPGKVQLLPLF